jgi:chromosome partitioning protein
MAKKSKLILMPTCYGLDDLDAQIEAAYELEENGIDRSRIWFIFSRTSGSANEEQTAREYLQRAEINVLEPVFAELPCIRQAHSGGKAASEVTFPLIRERTMALAVAVATKLQELSGAKVERVEAEGEAAA